MPSEAVEDYLRAIYEIQREQGKAPTTALSEKLGVTPPSVTGMIRKMAEMNLVSYEPYRGAELTDVGRKLALEVLRHHRLIERFLAEALGVPWDQVDDEAHKMEHVLSDYLEERIDAMLGHPTTCPHGSPIPTQDGSVDRSAIVCLADLQPGQSARVAEVNDRNPDLLRYLGELGVYPEVNLHVAAVAPFNGPLTVSVGEREHILGREVASCVLVTDVHPD